MRHGNERSKKQKGKKRKEKEYQAMQTFRVPFKFSTPVPVTLQPNPTKLILALIGRTGGCAVDFWVSDLMLHTQP